MAVDSENPIMYQCYRVFAFSTVQVKNIKFILLAGATYFNIINEKYSLAINLGKKDNFDLLIF